VYGGAYAVSHLPQVSDIREGRLFIPFDYLVSGSNLRVLVQNSTFQKCTVRVDSEFVHPGAANGAGGAVYIRSAALSIVHVTQSRFIENWVSINAGSTGPPSLVNGGALSVDAQGSVLSAVGVSHSSFEGCFARGADIYTVIVRGGALYLSFAAFVNITDSVFFRCSVFDALGTEFSSDKNSTLASIGEVFINGGSGACITYAMFLSVSRCVFDATNGTDHSETAYGLLVLHEAASVSQTIIRDSLMKADYTVFSSSCVKDKSLVSAVCDKSNVYVDLYNVSILQIDPRTLNGDHMLVFFPKNISVTFKNSILSCSRSGFAVFELVPMFSAHVAYGCKFCSDSVSGSGQISLSATSVFLDSVFNSDRVRECYPVASASGCPFGISSCNTFVRVTKGFWAELSDSGVLSPAIRCPRGYCTCSDSDTSCEIVSKFSLQKNPDSLCTSNRTGMLCGGCAPNYTQSMDEMSCISNQSCSENLAVIWFLCVMAWACLGLVIVPFINTNGGGLSKAVLLYLQMASLSYASGSSNAFIERVSGALPILSYLKFSCYALNMSAYDATAARLIGPLFVVTFSLIWTGALRLGRKFLLQRNIDIIVSFKGTCAVAVLFVFSSVANVAFALVECSSYSGAGTDVVFIDGTVPCFDAKWKALVGVLVIMCLFPTVFAVLLWKRKLSTGARAAVCEAFREPKFYWGAITLQFRMLLSILQFLHVAFPNLLAIFRAFLSLLMLCLLMVFRPYKYGSTFWVDVSCYVCLITQFSLQSLGTSLDYLGVVPNDNQFQFFEDMSTLSAVIRSG
jgi:hypothetical protein